MDLISILPIVLSGIAVSATAIFGYFTLADRRSAARLSREGDLHKWVQKIAELVADIRILSGKERDAAVIRLPVQIDYGRLHFPNEDSPDAQKWHPKGRRSSILDPLAETCKRAANSDWNDEKFASDWRQFIDQLRKRTTAFQSNTSPEAAGEKQYRNP